jgi:hypothetical protein
VTQEGRFYTPTNKAIAWGPECSHVFKLSWYDGVIHEIKVMLLAMKAAEEQKRLHAVPAADALSTYAVREAAAARRRKAAWQAAVHVRFAAANQLPVAESTAEEQAPALRRSKRLREEKEGPAKRDKGKGLQTSMHVRRLASACVTASLQLHDNP